MVPQHPASQACHENSDETNTVGGHCTQVFCRKDQQEGASPLPDPPSAAHTPQLPSIPVSPAVVQTHSFSGLVMSLEAHLEILYLHFLLL